jgi:DNA-binding NtrC family response regulator
LLTTYDWPGNVRQLENVMERLMVRTRERYIMTGLVRGVMQSLRGYPARELEQSVPATPVLHSFDDFRIPLDASLAEIERMIIRRVVQEEQGNRVVAAERLKIGRTTLWRKLKED